MRRLDLHILVDNVQARTRSLLLELLLALSSLDLLLPRALLNFFKRHVVDFLAVLLVDQELLGGLPPALVRESSKLLRVAGASSIRVLGSSLDEHQGLSVEGARLVRA